MSVSGPECAALVRFLLARVDEDDAELRRLKRLRPGTDSTVNEPADLRSLRRLRVECDVKRQIIGHAQALLVLRDLPNEREVRDRAACQLRAMAEPYSDHPGYRRKWAVHPAAVSRRLMSGG